MTVELFGAAGSPYVRAARLGLEEKGVPHDFVAIDPMTLKGPENLARHPFGRMPSLAHDGFALYETQAILRYVDAAFPGPALQPADPRRAARMNQVIGIVDCYLFASLTADVVFERLIAPHLFGRPADEARIAAALPQAARSLGAIAALLGEGPFLAGDALTLADLHALPHVAYATHVPEGTALLAPHPGLRGWIARMTARDSFARATRRAA